MKTSMLVSRGGPTEQFRFPTSLFWTPTVSQKTDQVTERFAHLITTALSADLLFLHVAAS